jgi:hypothetical protein
MVFGMPGLVACIIDNLKEEAENNRRKLSAA